MINGFPAGMNNLPPMARNSFLFASTSLEARCQCPIVTPMALNGAGCAAAVPAVRVDASNKAANRFVFTECLPEFLLLTGDAKRTLSGRGKGRKLRPAESFPQPKRGDFSLGCG